MTHSYQAYYCQLSSVFDDCLLLILNLVGYCPLLSVAVYCGSLNPLECCNLILLCAVLCARCLSVSSASGRTSQKTRSTLNCFVGLSVVPTETQGVTHTKGVTHSHFGYTREIALHYRRECDSQLGASNIFALLYSLCHPPSL